METPHADTGPETPGTGRIAAWAAASREKLWEWQQSVRRLAGGRPFRRAVRKAKALTLKALSAAGEEDEGDGDASSGDEAADGAGDGESVTCAVSGPFPDTAIAECMPEVLLEVRRKAELRFQAAAAAVIAATPRPRNAAWGARRAAELPAAGEDAAPPSSPPPQAVAESFEGSRLGSAPALAPHAAPEEAATPLVEPPAPLRLPVDVSCVWATCLAVCALESMNSCWLAGEREEEDVTSVDKATLWLARQAREHPELDAAIDEVMASARARVRGWRAAQAAAIARARRVNATHNRDRWRYEIEHLQGWLALSVRRNHGARRLSRYA